MALLLGFMAGIGYFKEHNNAKETKRKIDNNKFYYRNGVALYNGRSANKRDDERTRAGLNRE